MKFDDGGSHRCGSHEGWLLGGPRGRIRATGERDSNPRRCSGGAARRGGPETLISSLHVFVFVYLDETVFVYHYTTVFVFVEGPASAISISLSFLYFSLIYICV